MKALFKTFTFLFIVSLAIIACDTEDDEATPASTTSNSQSGNNTGGGSGGNTTVVNINNNTAKSSSDSAVFNYYNINVITNNNTLNLIEISVSEKDPTNPQTAGQFGAIAVLQVKVLPTASTTYNHVQSMSSNFSNTEYVVNSIKLLNEKWYSRPAERHDEVLDVKFENGTAIFTMLNATLQDDFSNPTKSDEISIKFSIPVSELKDSANSWLSL